MNRSRRFHRRQAMLTWFAVALLVLLQIELLPRFSVNEPIASNTDKSVVSAQYANLPLAFEPNQGQVDGDVSYLVHHGQATTYFDGVNTTTTLGDDHVTMSLDGANRPNFTGTDPLESKTNYFIGNDQSKWQSNVPNYKEILAQNVYPGIDLKYYGTNSQLEHDFIVNPGADPKQITFHFDGQQNLSLDDKGNLVLKTASNELHLNAPTTYQLGEHSKYTIPSQFELDGNTVTVALNEEYDHSKSLVIDPTLAFIYSTFLGGTGSDEGYSIAVDASGNTYVSGRTDSTNFPTSSPFQASNSGGTNDAFVTKLNPAGSAVLYSTYLGGSGLDEGYSLAVDATGNAYVAGYTTSTNYPTSSPFQGSHGGGVYDAFVSKLNTTGSALTYSTYLGGSGEDEGYDIALDSSDNAYITGRTASSNFPTSSPFQAIRHTPGYEVFVTKFNATGSGLTYSTFLGGTLNDQGSSIAVDATGNAYIVGYTSSVNFPTSSPYQASMAGGTYDAFVTKFNPAGSALTYSTYLGGSTGSDLGFGISVDATGDAYVMGNTSSTDFPTSSPYQVTNGGGSYDAFVTKFNPAGSALTYSTYLGGNSIDFGYGFAIDGSGNAYVAGYTDSTNFPTTIPIQASYGGSDDAFVAKLNVAGSALTYSTYLGGTSSDLGNGIALGLNGNAYVTGYAGSAGFPTSSAYQAAYAGGAKDAFIAQLTEHNVNLTAQVNPTLTFTVGSTSCSLGTLSVSQTQFCTYTLTAATNGTSGYTISYLPVATLTSGGNTITALSALTASTLNTEQFGINLRANTALGSHTANAFGANVSGGSGTVALAYNTPDSFKLVVAGDTVATAGSPSLTSTYAVSTIANITNTTEAGSYTTTLTYNIVAGY